MDHTGTMTRHEQEALTGPASGLRRRVWCRGPGCGRELTDAESRRRGYGEECDPDYRTTTPAHEVDQETLPGL